MIRLQVVERSRLHPVLVKLANIRRVPPVRPINNVSLRYRSLEAIGLRHRPVRQQPTAAPARHAKLLRIDIPQLHHRIHRIHQVMKVIVGIVVFDNIRKLLPITRRSARVGIHHHIPPRRHPQHLVIEDPSIRRMRTAMDVEDERILLLRVRAIEARRQLHKSINRLPGNIARMDCRRHLHLLRHGKIQLAEQRIVDMRQLRLRLLRTNREKIPNQQRIRNQRNQFLTTRRSPKPHHRLLGLRQLRNCPRSRIDRNQQRAALLRSHIR